MKLSLNKILKLRSGQGVWRVHARYEAAGLLVSVERYYFCGKKVLHHFETSRSSIKFSWKGYSDRAWRLQPCHFLADAIGHGAFTSRKHAECFAEEIRQGLHPEIVENARFLSEARMYRNSREGYYDSFNKDLSYTDEQYA